MAESAEPYREFLEEIARRIERVIDRGMARVAWDSAEPYREFMHELILRIERVSREETRRAEIKHREVMAEIREFREEHRERMEELHAESQAQRRALLAMIDRLQGNGPEPAT